MTKNLTVFELLSMQIDQCDALDAKQKIELKLQRFNKFIAWSDDDYERYDVLLDSFKKIRSKKNPNTTELGQALEKLVTFIFDRSFFYQVFENKRTSTHEIDQFVILSDNGIQALEDYKFSKDLLLTKQNYLLCECKNYKGKVSATWVGKFNTLLDVSGKCQLGIIFSCDGLTGRENNWYDAHGLTKIIYHLSENEQKKFILDFNLEDFEKLKEKNTNIFDIIKTKKMALLSNVKSEKLLDDLHEGVDEIKEIYEEINEFNYS